MEERPRKNSLPNLNNNNNNNNILSSLYIDYQNNEQDNEEGNIKRINSVQLNEIYKRNCIFDFNINENDDFIKMVLAKLDEIEKKSESIFNNLINQYKICYDEYRKRIIEYLKDKEKNISKVNENQKINANLSNYAKNNIFKKINHLSEIHDNIINNIENNFELLNIFLSEKDLINKQNPLQDFLINHSTMIYFSSVLSRFKFEEIDISKIRKINYYNKYLEYLNSEKKDESIISYRISKDNIETSLKFLESSSGIKTIKVKDVAPENLIKIINVFGKNIDYLDKFKIKNCKFDFQKGNEGKIKSKEVKIKNGIIFNLKQFSEIFIRFNTSLINLYLEKVDMSNFGFKTLMVNLYKNNNILNNLEYLSLSGNEITSINREAENDPYFTQKFKKLKILDLSKNDIYKFEMPLIKFPELKLLDLSSNSILSSLYMDFYIKEEKNKLVLFNNNIFISNCSNNNVRYNEYLCKILQKLDFDLKILNLSFTYNVDNQNSLEKLKLSPALKISLLKIDLSYCGLCTDVLINFLKNNFGLFSLQKLKLDYNNIQCDIFEKLLYDDILLENLNVLDLNQNKINCEKYIENECLIKIIQKFTNLKCIKLVDSSFYNFWNLNISPDFPDKRFRTLYSDLLKYLKINKRKFKLVVEDEMCLEKDFIVLFEFKNN